MSAIVELALQSLENGRVQRLHSQAKRHSFDTAENILSKGEKVFRLSSKYCSICKNYDNGCIENHNVLECPVIEEMKRLESLANLIMGE